MRIDRLLLIFSLLFVLFSHSASALSSIEVTSPRSGAVYNVGDSVAVTGQITLDQSVAGALVSFSAVSKKLNKTMPITTKIYSFTASTPVTFSQINKGTLSWSVPFDTVQSEDWQIYVSIDKEPQKIVEFFSTSFSISKSLLISVSSNTRLLNLGETIEASGTVLDANSNPINGNAIVTIGHALLGSVSSETIPVQNGFIDFRYSMKRSDPPGNYSITFKVSDINGNTGLRLIQGIVVSDKLNINCTLPGAQFTPGGEFDVIGNLKDIHDRPAEAVPITSYLTFPTQPISLNFNSNSDANGNFAVRVELPKLAEPGTYSLSVVAEDSNGNTGTCYQTFSIAAQKDVLVGLKLNSSWYYQTTEAGLELNIKNSGNIDLLGTVSVLVDNKEVDSFDFATKKGEDKTQTQSWAVSVIPGEHTISALLTSADGKILTQTPPQPFTVYAHPGQPKKFELSIKWAFILVGIAFIIGYLFLKRKEIRDYLWHWELKRKYGVGLHRVLPNFKKSEPGA